MRRLLTFTFLLALLALLAWKGVTPVQADEPSLTFPTTPSAEVIAAADSGDFDKLPFCGLSGGGLCFNFENRPAATSVECVGGMAGDYPCSNVDLEAFLPLANLNSSQAASLWGYTDEDSGREFALIAMSDGTVFVEITNAENPVFLGKLPSHTGDSLWRELKTYQHYAFIVADSNGAHGIQVFDLDQLLNVNGPPVTFTETAHYAGVNSVHNIVIDTDAGFAYAVGSNSANCGSGLHMVDIRNPLAPTYAGCYGGAGYVHDAQCLTYPGPDTDHIGKEICITSDVDAIHVVDVSNKSNPVQISTASYPNPSYIHQSWLTPDNQYMVLDDELDNSGGEQTNTYIWDMRNLDAPLMIREYLHPGGTAIDHNQYTKDHYVFQANYREGLRVLDASDIANENLTEIGYFDIYPTDDAGCFSAAWNVYPYFDSGVVIVSGIEQGLFVLRPTNLTAPTAVEVESLGVTGGGYDVPVVALSIGVLALTGLVLALRRKQA